MNMRNFMIAMAVIFFALLAVNIALTVHDKGKLDGNIRGLHTLINDRHHDALLREQEKTEHAKNASLNRAINVESWCTKGINSDRQYNRDFVAQLGGRFGLNYSLRNLNCLQIIELTLQSGVTKPVITAKSNPVVFKAIKAVGVDP